MSSASSSSAGYVMPTQGAGTASYDARFAPREYVANPDLYFNPIASGYGGSSGLYGRYNPITAQDLGSINQWIQNPIAATPSTMALGPTALTAAEQLRASYALGLPSQTAATSSPQTTASAFPKFDFSSILGQTAATGPTNPTTSATPATPATPATTQQGGATPTTPATSATPAKSAATTQPTNPWNLWTGEQARAVNEAPTKAQAIQKGQQAAQQQTGGSTLGNAVLTGGQQSPYRQAQQRTQNQELSQNDQFVKAYNAQQNQYIDSYSRMLQNLAQQSGGGLTYVPGAK